MLYKGYPRHNTLYADFATDECPHPHIIFPPSIAAYSGGGYVYTEMENLIHRAVQFGPLLESSLVILLFLRVLGVTSHSAVIAKKCTPTLKMSAN